MPMQMAWRWYGEGNDQIKLSDIKQIPGKARPGYGLYDRALGIQHMLGVWDMLDKEAQEK